MEAKSPPQLRHEQRLKEMKQQMQIDQDTDVLSRFTLICKPEQSGKTFEMLKRIVEDISSPPCDKTVVNIIFCDNNLLLTKQTSERVKKHLKKASEDEEDAIEISGEPCLEFSSKAKDANVGSVSWAITAEGIANILCCTNGKRVKDAQKIIAGVDAAFPGRFFFKIWLDEADKYVKHIDTTFKPLIEARENVAMYGLTATPKKLFTHYGSLNVFPLENTTSGDYHGWEDNTINLIDATGSSVEFVSHVLRTVGSGFIKAGTKWYIPAEHKKVSHRAVKDICSGLGFATIIINGDGIRLYLPDTTVYEYPKDKELNIILKSIYQEHDIARFPLAITGNICIGRGISLMSEDFMLDYGILSSCHNPQESSQNAGRMKGNMKSWANYKPPVVFTTERFNKVAKEWEAKSRGLAELAFKKESEGRSTVITKQEFKGVGKTRRFNMNPLTDWVTTDTEPKTVKLTDPDDPSKQKSLRCKMQKNDEGLWVHTDGVVRIDGGYSLPGGPRPRAAGGGKQNVLEYNPERTMYRIVQYKMIQSK